MSTDALNPVCAGRLNVTKPSPRPPYTHFGKVFELIDRRFAVHRPTQKCLVGPNQEPVARTHWQQDRKTAPAASMTAAWRSAAAATTTFRACRGLNIGCG
jgi:hypothetical protein